MISEVLRNNAMKLVYILCTVVHLVSCVRNHYGFNKVAEVYLPDSYLHLEINLSLSTLKEVREKTLKLKRTAIELVGLCAYSPLSEETPRGLDSTSTKHKAYLDLVKDTVFNDDAIRLNPLRDSFTRIGESVDFSSEDVRSQANRVIANIRTKRETTNRARYTNFHNGQLISTTYSLGRQGEVISVADNIHLDYEEQAKQFLDEVLKLDNVIDELRVSLHKDELCNVSLYEIELISSWGSTIFDNFIYVIDKLTGGRIPRSMFTSTFINALQTKINEKVNSGGVSASDLNLLDYAIKAEENLLQVIIFIPLYKEKFDLYEFSGNLPFLLFEDKTYSLQVSPVNEHKFIAVSSNNNFLMFSDSDLNRCTKTLDKFYCPQSIKYLNQEILDDECMYNLYREDPEKIFSSCNILGKLVSNYAEELSPNCFQITTSPDLEIESSEEANESNYQYNEQAKIVELTNITNLVKNPSFVVEFDSSSSEKTCEITDYNDMAQYWGKTQELPDFVKNRISSLEPFQKKLLFAFSDNIAKTDYLRTHIYNLESHLHIVITLIILSGVKMILVKIFELLMKCAKTMRQDEPDVDSGFNEMKPLNADYTKPIVNAPVNPGLNMYPNPPMM